MNKGPTNQGNGRRGPQASPPHEHTVDLPLLHLFEALSPDNLFKNRRGSFTSVSSMTHRPLLLKGRWLVKEYA